MDMEQLGYFIYMQEQEDQADQEDPEGKEDPFDINLNAESDNNLVSEWITKRGSERKYI